ncbi:MAG: toxin-antitoxin system YwqK family antitoxin [Crocinitomicaceae bacterium]|jgi:antitoxin component YwqK of YwqJK toxin-antitoxin module|nr:toxin-antitoxin system YwqK family antitoxin [Crocinitomicaceae bacterium]MBK6952215.1 toxin-antitoxin system YwqK family antitoxin [Crocinitomicaceae bacterium]
MRFIFAILFLSVTFCGISQVNQTDANGMKQGVWKKAYDNSGVYKYTGQFKDDKPYGKFVYYYETGEVEAVINFSDDGSVGYSKMYHESGYLMARGKYTNQLKDSTWIYFDDRGIVSYQEEYKNGKLNGIKVVYYQPVNGQYLIAKYFNYRDDLMHGEFKTYHPSTALESEGSYDNGKLHGTIKYYYPNGKYLRIERYNYGVRHGYWIFYNDDGTQAGYKLFWEGKELKGEALAKKEAELKEKKAGQ